MKRIVVCFAAKIAILTLALAILIPHSASWADKVAPNKQHIVSSENQKYYIVFVPSEGYEDKGSGVAFETKPGADRFLWSVNWYAKKVYLCNNGENLIRIGPWAKN